MNFVFHFSVILEKMNRYNPNAKWAVLMCRHAKNNTEIRNIESKYRDWQSAGLVQYFIIDTQGDK